MVGHFYLVSKISKKTVGARALKLKDWIDKNE